MKILLASDRLVKRTFSLVILTSLFMILTLVCIGQEDDIISVDSSLVILNATITDKNNAPISGLSKDAFEILEDGEKQKVEFFETQETPFAAAILIDTSGSMEMRVSLARSAAIKFLENLRAYDNVAIYNFDSKVSLVQEFSNLRDLTHRAFDLKAKGWTVLNDAIYKASMALAKRPEKRKAIIVLSDGADTKSGRSANKALNKALESNATIYTVDMSALNTGGRKRMQNQGALKNFAKKSGGQFVKTPGGVELRAAFVNIAKELGTQYTIGYYPSNQERNGKWRKIELNVSNKNLNVRTRKGYIPPKK